MPWTPKVLIQRVVTQLCLPWPWLKLLIESLLLHCALDLLLFIFAMSQLTAFDIGLIKAHTGIMSKHLKFLFADNPLD